eukprot:2516098-Pleurochrysis_carterae.AAC.1
MNTTPPVASLHRLCAPHRFHSAGPIDVKSLANLILEVLPNASSPALLARLTACAAAAGARASAPRINALSRAVTAVAMVPGERMALAASRQAQHTDPYVANLSSLRSVLTVA